MAGVRRAGGRFLAARDAATSTGGGNAYFFGGAGAPVPRALLEDLAPGPAVDVVPTPPPPSAAASRVTPAVLFVTVVLAVVLLVSGLLHVLRRLFLKTHHAGTGAGERHHLQHLFFPAHDDGAGGAGCSGGGGLAQAAIDALPEFAYAELSGAAGAAAASSRKGKEKAARPFDCAVCLCEFAGHDRLRLLPPCGHAFHVACIDVWLRSCATCPLCRTKLSRAAAPSVGNDDGGVEEEDESKQQQQDHDHQAPSAEPAASSVVLPVRLGRFQIADDADNAAAESSTGSRIDKRRCYSMGSYQYVLADEQLLVSVHLRHHGTAGAGAAAAAGSGDDDHHQPQQVGNRKVFARGDSFSVSKIWQWRGSRRLPGALCADDGGLPWAPAPAKDGDDRSTANPRQHGDT